MAADIKISNIEDKTEELLLTISELPEVEQIKLLWIAKGMQIATELNGTSAS